MPNYNPSRIDITSEPNAAKGRPKGVPNKITMSLRETVNKIVGGQLDYFAEALEAVRVKDPAKYLSLATRMLELVMPKMQEVALTSAPTIDIEATISEMKEKLGAD